MADVATVTDIGTDGLCCHASLVQGAAAARAVLQGATLLAQNAYKLALFETLVRSTILQAMNQEKT